MKFIVAYAHNLNRTEVLFKPSAVAYKKNRVSNFQGIKPIHPPGVHIVGRNKLLLERKFVWIHLVTI